MFGYSQTETCSRSSDCSLACDAAAKVESEPVELKICDPARTYPRTSVEGVALSSLASIETAHDFYAKLDGRTPALRRANLMILPTIEKLYPGTDASGRTVTLRELTADNLAYAPEFAKAPLFLMFPKSRQAERAGLWRDLNLWEVPWGVAHEYGHHVFRTHTGIEGEQTHLWSRPSPRGAASDLPPASTQSSGAGRGQDVWNAVNEGFADLYAHYVFGSKPEQLRGVDCFDVNRDPASERFVVGTKRLTTDVLDTFMGARAAAPRSCDEPDFHDGHFLGAIVAHGVDALFSVDAAGTGDGVAAEKGDLLLAWAERLGTTARAKGMAQMTFALMVRDAFVVAAGRDGRLGAEQCAVADEVFPGLVPAMDLAGLGCP
jgi:hypothetical protein